MSQQNEVLYLKVISPAELLYEGDAKVVSALNESGPFDVLYGHTNFFSVLKQCAVVVDTGEVKQEFPISHGLIKVHDNKVTVYADINTDK
jgi:F-type H+-transporting ATPase subunit epsilon